MRSARDDGYGGEAHRFVGGWDLMGLIPDRARTCWPGMWKLSRLHYDQIGCVSTTGRCIDTLVPISVPGGRKAVVIRTSDPGNGLVLIRDAQPNSGRCDGHELNDAT